MDGVSVGVVGCGYWGSKHVRVLQGVAGVERVVAIDARPDRLAEVARTYPSLASSCFADLDSAIDHVDALVVATPPNTHLAVALAAINASKGVLVEKPLATSVADTDLLIDAAAGRGVTLMAGHTFEYNAAVWKVRELIETGELGDVLFLDSARLNLGLYQPDVNVIWDLAPHDVSIFNHLMQAMPSHVQAWGGRHAHPSLEDVAHIHLEYAELPLAANIHVSWLDPVKVRKTTVVGDRQMLVYNDLDDVERVRVFDKGVDSKPRGVNTGASMMSYRFGDIRSPYIEFHEPLVCQDQHFVNCVISGKRPATDGEAGRNVVAVLEAAQISLAEQRQVALDEILPSFASPLSMTAGS
jgi:predicted dehydrogenase